MLKRFFTFCVTVVLISLFFTACDTAPKMAEMPERIEKAPKEKVKDEIKSFEEDSGEGQTILTVTMPEDDSKALSSDHNIQYDYFLLTTTYLSDRRDGSSITGVYDGLKISAGDDGARSEVDMGYFTQGKWRFEIKALNSDGDVLYMGAATTYITAGKENSLTITMEENSGEVGRIVFDTLSIEVPLPRIVVKYTKVWNGDGEKVLLDTGADGKGLEMENLANGYTTYKTPEIIMPSGAYWLTVQLWSGDEIFSGEVLDTFIVPSKTTTISGVFTITGLAEFIRVNPKEKFTFCEAASRFDIATDKMITGFHLLGKEDFVEFPYENTSEELEYLIPTLEDVNTYFYNTGSVLTEKVKYPNKYVAFNSEDITSPIEISASLFSGDGEGLKGIYAPSVRVIGESAFEGSVLEECEFGALEEIGAKAFKGTNLVSFGKNDFSNSISFGDEAFASSKIQYIDIPSGARVGNNLFMGCTELYRISYLAEELPDDTFNGCTKLGDVTLNNETERIGARAFKGCKTLKTLEMPEEVKEIGASAFENCTSLETLSINNKIKKIGANTFKGCTSVEEIYIYAICGDIEGDPWGLADRSKITYWAYKLFFNSNLPSDYVKAEGEEEFPMLLKRNNETLAVPVADPKYRLIAYNDVVGNTLCGYEIPIPLIDGYALRGWFTDPAAGKEIKQLTVNTKKDNWTVYAHWVRGLITVIFSGGRGGNSDVGKADETYRMVRYQGYYGYVGEEDEADDYAKTLPQAHIAGRDFKGWYLDPEPMIDDISPNEEEENKMTAITDSSQVLLKKSHTLYAHYTDHRYTVEFDANLPTNAVTYGTRNGTNVYSSYNTPSSYRVVYNQPYNKQWNDKLSSTSNRGTTVSLPDLNEEKYKLDNYYFCGWYLEPECKTRVYDNTRVAAQSKNGTTIKLYAKWIGKEKIVNYVSRYKALPTDKEYKEETVLSVIQRFSAPSKSTDEFKAYYNSKVTSGKEMDIKEDKTFSLPVITTTTNTSFYRAGYTHTGWYTVFDNASNSVKGISIVDNVSFSGSPSEVSTPGTQTLYAAWTPNTYNVTYDSNGGAFTDGTTTKASKVVFHNKYGEQPPTPVRAGYVFTGWYTTTVREQGYGYKNSTSHITSDSYVLISNDHTLYAGWTTVAVIEEGSNNPTPLNKSLEFSPKSNGGSYGDGESNIATQTVRVKTVATLNTTGRLENSRWVDIETPTIIARQSITVTTSNNYISSFNVTSDDNGLATISVSTTNSAVPGTTQVTLDTVSKGKIASGILNIALKGKLTSITLVGPNSIYVRNKTTITAKLSSSEGNLHKSHLGIKWEFIKNADSYTKFASGVVTDSLTSAWTINPFTTTGASSVISFFAGYTVVGGSNSVQIKATNSASGTSQTISIAIEQPIQTIAVANNAYVGSFFDNVAAVYNAYATARAQWVITGFRDWEGGDPASSSADTSIPTTIRNPGVQNTTGHTIYLYPIRSVICSSENFQVGALNDKAYIAFPTNATKIGTNMDSDPGSNAQYSSAVKVYIAGSNVTIGQRAFSQINHDCEFRIAGSIHTAKHASFFNSPGIRGITSTDFSRMVTIDRSAFSYSFGNTSAIDVNLSSCTSLGWGAFLKSNVGTLSTPITAERAFQACSNLRSVNCSAQTVENACFARCTSLSYVVLSRTVTLKAAAFSETSSLRSINLPSTLTTLQNHWDYNFHTSGQDANEWWQDDTGGTMQYGVFEKSGLTSINMSNTQISYIGTAAFYGCGSLSSVSFSGRCNNIGQYAFKWSGLSGNLSLPSSITTIQQYAFDECNNITSLTIGGNGVNIGLDAFARCDRLSSVTFSSTSAITLAQGVFYDCTNLTTVDFLAMGSNFNKSSFGNSVWGNCKLRYVKLTQDCFPTGYNDLTLVDTNGWVDSKWTRYTKSPCISQYIICRRTNGGGWFFSYQYGLKCKGHCNGSWWTVYDKDSGGAANDTYDGWPSGSHGALLPYAYCEIYKQCNGGEGWWYVTTWAKYMIRANNIGSVCIDCWKKISSSYKWSISGDNFRESSYDTSPYCNDYVYPNQLWALFPIN